MIYIQNCKVTFFMHTMQPFFFDFFIQKNERFARTPNGLPIPASITNMRNRYDPEPSR